MRVRSLVIIATVLSLLLLATIVSAGTAGIGTPTLRVVAGVSNQSAVIYSDGITDGGLAGNGAISWDIYFTVPSTVGLADFTVTAGPAWVAQCPGSFTVVKTAQGQASGQNAFYVNGVCTAARSGPAVTGSDVQVATLAFTSSCATTGTFNVNLDVGPTGDWTDMFDTNNDLYIFPANALTDGGGLCTPAAVTMSGFDANSANPAGAVGSIWPLLAAGVAVAAGGAYALSRRKR